MADEPLHDAESSPDLNRPKRAPPTIDLTATDVTLEATDASKTAGEATPDDARPRSPGMASALIAAGSGATAAALVIAVAWLAGWPGSPAAPEPASPQANTALDDLAARVARVESRASAPASAAATDSGLPTRIETLEKSLEALRGDIGTLRSQTERTAAAVNELKSAPRDVSAPPDLSAINSRVAQIENAVRAQGAATAQQNARPADDAGLRRIVAAALLDTSVRQGDPYAAALAAARSLAADAVVLKPLELFATSGVPNVNAMGLQLNKIIAGLVPPRAGTTTGSGIVDRLQAGAARLVRIERTDAVAGDDRGTIVARATAAAQRGDLAAAQRELAALAPVDRAPFQPWIDQVDAREAALGASRQFAADAMTAFSKSAR